MTEQISFPPLLDLSPAELQAQKQHLLTEIGQEFEPRRRLPSLNWTPLRLAGVAGVAAAAVAIAVALVPTGGGRSPVGPRSVSPPLAPLYSFHASVTSYSPDGRYFPSSLPIPSHTKALFSRERVPRAVSVVAAAQAHSFGNRGRTLVEWVKTTRQKAVSAENAGRVDGANLPVYFVILHGHFVDSAPLGPLAPLGPTKRGLLRARILTNTIEIKTGRALDFGITNSEPDFSKIGKPHSFVIYGHRSSR